MKANFSTIFFVLVLISLIQAQAQRGLRRRMAPSEQNLDSPSEEVQEAPTLTSREQAGKPPEDEPVRIEDENVRSTKIRQSSDQQNDP